MFICAVWSMVAYVIHITSYKGISTMDYNEFMESFLAFLGYKSERKKDSVRFTGMGTITPGKVWPQKVTLQKLDPKFDYKLKLENLIHNT